MEIAQVIDYELVLNVVLVILFEIAVKDTDRISLVVYDTNVELVFGLMKMTEENRKKARAFVSSIKDGSSTNLCGGLLAG